MFSISKDRQVSSKGGGVAFLAMNIFPLHLHTFYKQVKMIAKFKFLKHVYNYGQVQRTLQGKEKKKRTLPSSIRGLYVSVTLSRKHVGINIFIL